MIEDKGVILSVGQELRTRRAHPSIPWPEVIGMRNRHVHVYFNIDLPLVWDTVCNDPRF